MKNTAITFLLLAISIAAVAQHKGEVKELTAQEVSDRLIETYAPLAFSPISPITLEQIKLLRAQERAMPIPVLTNSDSVDVDYVNIPGLLENDPPIPVRIYKPKGVDSASIFLWFHGGGFVQGTLNWDHQSCANIAQHTKSIVISVDYRLSPESTYPAAVNDGYSVFLWSIANAKKLKANPKKIAVGGGSAGASIAGSLVLMNREKSGPPISFQVLFFPAADVDLSRASVKELWNIPGIKGADIPVLFEMYVGNSDLKNVPENILPGITSNFKNIPATYLVTCGVDPLRDGALAYGIKLIQSGIPVELHNYPGYPHGALPNRMYPELYSFMNEYFKDYYQKL
ncbi:alpha/beta hydrolase [Sphingobacterium hungaricum]|uniref:Alpha/beta hydrolase fold-3 domain-containing protein n=1 Tax=Sphingobacterium hungaricum TaxID=2082723 RepID=A0A928UY30_9SPHI|nr:alpha/beta hydrolase [Sphingobacterium hungaricum]MBE8712907.1 hypothetical protein [Sphingobacterium hungaricum]